MESQAVTSLVALDLSAAFDTVDHDILLSILRNKCGIHGKALKWFNEYLRPCSFKVAIKGVYNKERNLEGSVSQGSCAGANIFNLYCSPLQDVILDDLKLSGFADDHSVRGRPATDERIVQPIHLWRNACLILRSGCDEAWLKMNPA